MKFVTTLLLFVNTIFCAAQLPQCYVYTVTGEAFVMQKGRPTLLKQGSLVFKTDTITLKKSASVMLLDYANKFISLGKPGKYTYPDLQKSLDVKPTGITQKFFQMLWEDLLSPASGKFSMSPDVIGGVAGGANRDLCGLDLFEPANNSKLANDTICFRWRSISHAKSYRFVLTDSAGNEFINVVLRDTSFAILSRDLLKGERTSYSWTAGASGLQQADCQIYFTVVSASEKQRSIGELIPGANKDNHDFYSCLKIIEQLAYNGWYQEASEYYEEAREMIRKQSIKN